MKPKSRYRLEGDTRCVDIRLRSARQLFDNRDPAPFRERDLDPIAVEHFLTAASEIRRQYPMKFVLVFSEEYEGGLDQGTLRAAFRAHFEHERDLASRRISENFRLGRRLLFIGLSVLGVFLTLGELTSRIPVAPLRPVLHEGLTITGWVAMWRPVEVLLYDWLPLLEQRRRVERILSAELEIRVAAARSVASTEAQPTSHSPAAEA